MWRVRLEGAGMKPEYLASLTGPSGHAFGLDRIGHSGVTEGFQAGEGRGPVDEHAVPKPSSGCLRCRHLPNQTSLVCK